MTQDEAKKRWCPFAHSRSVRFEDEENGGGSVMYMPANKNRPTTLCVAGDCMAFRWITENTPDGRGIQASKTEGYCGLAGKP